MFIVGCGDRIPEIDISNVNLETNIKRLEVDLFQKKDNLSFDDFGMLKDDYGDFLRIFTENIIAVGSIQDSHTVYYLNHFRNDLQVREIYETTIGVFPDLSLQSAELNDAFKRFSVLFPGSVIPDIFTFISAFSYTIVVDDSLLGIGLDMYLGSDQKYYRLLDIPMYKIRNMNKESIASDCMKSWLSTEFELEAEKSDLLSNMIYHGKLLYALDLLLPGTEDSIKIGYSSNQIEWVNENAKDMWFHFTENELLYTKEGKEIQKYIGDAPFTPGFPEGSPGMTGRWLGWQIVRSYMQNTDPLKVKNLFEESDSQKILKISKYKPK